MFATYLSSKLELNVLGYFERVSESAVQYAECLLGKRQVPENIDVKAISKKLVYHYKDHSYVIDTEEAKGLLGDNIIKENSPEYLFANQVYNLFNDLTMNIRRKFSSGFTYVGDVDEGLSIIKLETD